MSTETESTSAVEYKDTETAEYARDTISLINSDLEAREQGSIISNGIPYSAAYEYNQKKAVNYAPANEDDTHEVSAGIVHEKIIAFVSIFLKYVFKHDIKVYKDGDLVPRLGDVYELGVDHSRKLENFKHKVALMYWEVFSQGDAFILEDWMVRNVPQQNAFNDGELVGADNMDYTLEFLEGLTYEDIEMIQTRKAESIVMDGRMVILGNEEENILQDQPRITLEETMTRDVAEQVFGSLDMWDQVPDEQEQMLQMGDVETLFNDERIDDTKQNVVVHRFIDKDNNRFNIFVNGVMMLPMKTPMTIFYPRGNYPITQMSAERVTGSARSRSIPAKTKFNADFLDWILKKMSLKFEQGIEPAILANGNYTLTSDMFKARQVTHGVKKSDYEFADPDNKGVTVPEYNFFTMIKEIVETQTVNQTTSGELSGNATATEIAVTDQNQQQKLGFLLDAIVNGWTDLTYRRCETIESKYTLKQSEDTQVDGQTISVYTNFTFMKAGIQNKVIFDDKVGEYDEAQSKELSNKLFKDAAKSRKTGNPTEVWLVDPAELRSGNCMLDVTIRAEKLKDSQLQLIQMFDEINQSTAIFGRSDQGGSINMEELKKDYLEVSGRSDDFFVAADLAQSPELMQELEGGQAQNTGSFGKPKVSDALAQEVGGNK